MGRLAVYLSFLALIVGAVALVVINMRAKENLEINNVLSVTPQFQKSRAVNINGNKVKSGADLSYIFIAADEKVDISLFNVNGNTVGESAIEQPLTDAMGNSSGRPMKSFYYQKVKSNKYRLQISGNEDFKFEVYLYDKEGNVNMKSFEVKNYGKKNYEIIFDKENAENSKIQSTDN